MADRGRGDDVGNGGGCWNRAFLVPRVHFDNGREELLLPVLLQSEVVGQGVCFRLQARFHCVFSWRARAPSLRPVAQVPLKAAWAVTIHKSQGMTLDAATVQVAGCFDVRTATRTGSRTCPVPRSRCTMGRVVVAGGHGVRLAVARAHAERAALPAQLLAWPRVRRLRRVHVPAVGRGHPHER